LVSLMVSESEMGRVLAELAEIRERLDRIERRLIPSVKVSAREMALIRRRASSPPEDYISGEQVREELEGKRR